MKNIYIQILDEQPTNTPLVLATVIATVGSTPQKPGSSALFGLAGLFSGTVGGGVVEKDVQNITKNALESEKSGLYHFNLDKDISNEKEAICGGQISVLIDATLNDHYSVFEQVKQSILQRIPGVLVTRITCTNDHHAIIHRFWITENGKHLIPSNQFKRIEPEIKVMLSQNKSGICKEIVLSVEEKNILFFLEPVIPPPHLVIAGAGHIGKALAPLGKLLDFEVTVIDDREEYANRINIPDADHIIVHDIGKAMQELKKTSDTFVVIVTTGHKNDAAALKPCIGSGAIYVGMIGSSNKIAKMRKKFIDEGWATPEQWDGIHAPIGLDICSKTVQEIALSIAAQLVQVRNNKIYNYA